LSNVRALQPFTAVVIERAPGKAIIQWTAAQNLNSRDTVKYNLMLQGKTIKTDLLKLIDTITNLSSDTAYTGKVMAFTKSGDTASASFYLDSLKGFVFFGDYSNRLHCFNIYTGDKVWQTQSYSPDYLNNMPTVAGSIVYVNGDVSGLFAFDLKTGAKLWNTKLPSSSGFVLTRQKPLYLNNKIYHKRYHRSN
jgi:hypothetical protein